MRDSATQTMTGLSPEQLSRLQDFIGVMESDEQIDLGGERPLSPAGAAFALPSLVRVKRVLESASTAAALGLSPAMPNPVDLGLIGKAGLAPAIAPDLDQLDAAGVDTGAMRKALAVPVAPPSVAVTGSGTAGGRQKGLLRVGPSEPLPTAVARRRVTRALLLGHASVLVAEPAAGKSAWLLSMAMAIVTERPDIAGLRVIDRPGGVLIVSNEDGQDEVVRRARAIMQYHAITEAEFKHPLRIIAGGFPVILIERAQRGDAPREAAGAARVREALRELQGEGNPAVLVVVDTLASVTRGLDENDAGDAQAVVALLNGLAREFDVAVEVVHHTSKQSGQNAGDQHAMRGSSAFAGGFRSIETMTRPPAGKDNKSGIPDDELKKWVKVEGAKNSYGPLADAQWFRKETVSIPAMDPDQPGVLCSETAVVLVPKPQGPQPPPTPQSERDAILAMVRAGVGDDPSVSFSPDRRSGSLSLHKAIEVLLGKSSKEANVIVADMLAEGLIVERALRRGGKPRRGVLVAECVPPPTEITEDGGSDSA